MDAELDRLVTTGKLDRESAGKIDRLTPGTFCRHKSWGVGKIESWDLMGDRILIGFEDKPSHPMKLKFAAGALEVIPANHILAQRLENKGDLETLAEKDPVELVRRTLVSHRNTILLDDLENILKGTLIPEGRYKTWWDNTKKKLREDRRFVVPSKRNLPLELRDDDVSPSASMIRDVTDASDLKTKAKAVEAILKDVSSFTDPVTELTIVALDLNTAARQNSRLFLGQAIELILVRMELQQACPDIEVGKDELHLADLLRAEQDRLGETLRGLGVSRQRQVLEVFPEAFGDQWMDILFALLNSAGTRGISEMTKFIFEQGHQEPLMAYLRQGLQHRSLSSDLVCWVCRERNERSKELMDDQMPAVIMATLERDHFDEEGRRTNRLAELIQDDAELVPDLVRGKDLNAVRGFARRLLMSPVFDRLTINSLLARIVRIHGEIAEIIAGEEVQAEELIVSWESLEKKKKDFDQLVNVEIPQNKKEIQLARSYGDLRENFEYKAAKDQERVLGKRRQETQQELSRARGTDFSKADVSKVSIGTISELVDQETGKSETFTILGAWDSEPSKGVIAYTTDAGKALIGKKVGEMAELPTEMDNLKRKVKIASIRAYNPN